MNDQEFEEQKRRVVAVVDEWLPLLGLDHWTVGMDFERGELKDAGVSEDWQGLGRCKANWPYQTARIEFFLKGFVDMESGDVEHHVVHELVHCLLDEIQPDTSDVRAWQQNEHAIEMTARALLRVKYLGVR